MPGARRGDGGVAGPVVRADLDGEPLAVPGDGGDVENTTISSYWVSGTSATRARTAASLPALEARVVAPSVVVARQRVTSGTDPAWRVSATETGYDTDPASDTFGLAAATYTHTVPADPAYDSCTVTTYAPYNKTNNLAGLESGSETDSVACSGSGNSLGAPAKVSRPAQVKAASRTYYDGAKSLTATPSYGQSTTVEQAVDYADGAFVWSLKGRTGYDTYGRTTSSTDGNGKTTTTTYTDDAYGLVTGVDISNPLSQSESQTLDPERGLVLRTVDANSVAATTQYDAAGRLTGAWTDSRATSGTPNYSFTYNLSQTGPTAVTTKRMNSTGGFITSTTLYDSLLRERQSQTPSAAGGRVVADTFYDSRGWVSQRDNRWYDSSTTPEAATIDTAAKLQAAVPSADAYTYDGLGRVIADASQQNGVTVSTARTVYNGDRTTVFPAQTGSAPVETTVTDPLGRTVELRQYTAPPTVSTPADTFTGTFRISGGTVTTTGYHFDGHGLQDTVTDDAGETWTTSYDLLGRALTKTDPVAGTSRLSYDGAGNLTQTIDSAGHAISYAYDDINRRTDQWASTLDARTDAAKTGHWDYDDPALTYAVGHLTRTTTYAGGAAYVTASTGFNVFGSSLGETVTIPAAEGALAGTYKYSHTYLSTTGLPLRDTYPAVGGLPAETLTHGYLSPLDLPASLTGLETDTDYDGYSRVQQATLAGSGGNKAFVTIGYDDHTNLVNSRTVSGSTGNTIDSHTYDYDLNGNLRTDTQRRNGSTDTAETRCYRYDDVQRLTASWTATDACAATPTDDEHGTVGDTLDPSAAYWTTWSYDTIGRRTAQVQHSAGVSTTYKYDGPVLASATSTSTTADGSSATTTAVGYQFDGTGNLHTRTGTAYGDQTLSWDGFGRLTQVSSSTKGDSAYTYDADGQLLTQHDPGAWTLYLPDGQLTLDTATQAVSGVRYYDLPGGDTAHRTGSGTAYGFDIADTHGTVELTLDSTAQVPTWRAFTPYGESRGTPADWYDDRTFLDKPLDGDTGFVDVGARYYDPAIGSFISLDPVFNPADPQSLSGYAYAGDNPITYSDPTGLMHPFEDEGSGSSSCYDACQAAASGGNGTGGSSAGGNNSTPGSTCSSAQTKKKHWWQRGLDWVADNKNMLIGAAAGIATFAGCEALSVGVGSVGCMAAAGAVGKLTTDALNGDIHSASDVADSLVTGAVEGAFAPELAAVDLVSQGAAVVDDVKHGDYAGAAGHTALGALDALTVVDGVKARGGGGKGCLNSFTAATPVLLANGTTKPIAEVALGDKVLAADPATGKKTAEPVVALHDNVDRDFVDLTVADTTGHRSVIHTTAHHPFWNATTHRWTDAAALQPGDNLQSATSVAVRVEAIHAFAGAHHMLNLTVEDLHTYYVLAGNTAVLVHNCGVADPNDLRPTHPINGDASSKRVASMRNQMKAGTFDWKESGPISVVTHQGETYVLDGHHRLDAAKRAGLSAVPVDDVTDQLNNGGFRGYPNMQDVLDSASRFIGNRLNPYKLR